jgi:hypothetical protein
MSHSHSHSSNHELPTGVTEPDTVDIRSIVGYCIGLTVVAIVAQIAMWLMFNGMASSAEASAPPKVYPLAADPNTERPPSPRLQTGVRTDHGQLIVEMTPDAPGVREALQELRAEEEATLDNYAWVDRNNNVVRIPIAEAMKLALQRGFPDRATAATAAAAAEPEAGKETR